MCSVIGSWGTARSGTPVIWSQSLMPLLLVPLASTPLWVIAILTLKVLEWKWWRIFKWEHLAGRGDGNLEFREQSVLRRQYWTPGVPHSTNLNPWNSPLLNLRLEFNPLIFPTPGRGPDGVGSETVKIFSPLEIVPTDFLTRGRRTKSLLVFCSVTL